MNTEQHTLPAKAAALLRRAADEGTFSGAALGVIDAAGQRRLLCVGATERGGGQPIDPETRFDLASLTKVLVTLPLVLQAVGRGELTLEDPVGRFFSSAGWFQSPSLADASVRSLLTHSSGLPAWRPLYAQLSDRRAALAAVLNTPLEEPGKVVYSDLGFMLLGALIERLHHQRLDAVAERDLFGPLGLRASGFGPLSDPNVAATEECGWRDRLLKGEVHDENATVWEGVSGHAGLFASLQDVLSMAHAHLSFNPRLAPRELLLEASRPQVSSSLGTRGLGWVSAGPTAFVGPQARGFGHTGFTGTSLWIEPEGGWAWVLLTNRVHPVRGDAAAIVALRRELHTLLTPEERA